MSKKTTYRLILKDSENRAVFVNCKNTPDESDLSLLLMNYTSLIKDEEEHEKQSEQNDKAVEKKADARAKEAKNTAAKLEKKDEPVKPEGRKRLPRIKKEERKLTPYH